MFLDLGKGDLLNINHVISVAYESELAIVTFRLSNGDYFLREGIRPEDWENIVNLLEGA